MHIADSEEGKGSEDGDNEGQENGEDALRKVSLSCLPPSTYNTM